MFGYTAVLNASHYNEEVLEIFSKIMPRFVLMSSQKSTVKDHIEICVLADEMDEQPVLTLIGRIDTNYPNGIKAYPLKLIRTDYSHLDACRDSQLAFLFNSDVGNIKRAIKFSKEHTILTMSYDASYLGNGVNVSVFLGRKVIPYINMDALGKSAIKLDNILVQISKIFQNDDGK